MDSGETKSPSRWLGDTPFEQVSGTIISGHYWFLDVFPLCYEMQVPMFCRDGNLINLQWVLIKEHARGLHIYWRKPHQPTSYGGYQEGGKCERKIRKGKNERK
jgi:hypothetical protein